MSATEWDRATGIASAPESYGTDSLPHRASDSDSGVIDVGMIRQAVADLNVICRADRYPEVSERLTAEYRAQRQRRNARTIDDERYARALAGELARLLSVPCDTIASAVEQYFWGDRATVVCAALRDLAAEIETAPQRASQSRATAAAAHPAIARAQQAAAQQRPSAGRARR